MLGCTASRRFMGRAAPASPDALRQAEHNLNRLKEKIEAWTFNVALVGVEKARKSTLVNALIGKVRLVTNPMQPPCTRVLAGIVACCLPNVHRISDVRDGPSKGAAA